MKTHLRLLLIISPLALVHAARAQVGVGTLTPDAKSALDIRATDKGLLIPRLTQAQRLAISSPPQGLMVYQTDGSASGGTQTGFWYYSGAGGWVFLDAAGGGSLTLPYSGSANTISTAFQVSNTGVGVGIIGSAATATGVSGSSAGGGVGVSGSSASGTGVVANSTTGSSFGATKSGSQTGRLATLINTNATNDSTALLVSSAGSRPALRAVSLGASDQAAIRGVKQAGADGSGVEGVITSGTSGQAAGVLGYDKSGGGTSSGVLGLTTGGYAVRGIASGSGGFGVSGSATDSYGVIGGSQTGSGVYGTSTATTNSVAGVMGVNNAATQSVGVLGLTTIGYGVRGVATASGGFGVTGQATDGLGVYGNSTSGNGVYGSSSSSSGVEGSSTSAAGVRGVSNANLASTGGVLGVNNGGTLAVGVLGTSSGGTGVRGMSGAGNSAGLAGVVGSSTNSSGTGVLGQTVSGYGVRGEATGSNGYGVIGVASSTNGIGVIGSASGAATGLIGQASGTGRAGYFNQNNSSYTGNAVEIAGSGTGSSLKVAASNSAGAAAEFTSAGTGTTVSMTNNYIGDVLSLDANANLGLYRVGGSLALGYPGTSFVARISTHSNPAGTLNSLQIMAKGGSGLSLNDDFTINAYGDMSVSGTLSKGGGSFKIDHPLDPENQYLYHSFVESPDMLNVYNGNVTLDARGEATVQLPDYFQALNRDFRYQLTSLGAFMPVFVKEQVEGNHFRIAGGTPGGEVSWQVTGIRQDKWANQNRIPNAAPKEAENRGKYLHPAAYGLPAARGIGYQPDPAAPAVSTVHRSAAPGQLNDGPTVARPAHLSPARHD